MHNEARRSEFVANQQGFYYPTVTPTNFAYYCTGFESPADWEDQRYVFGFDGPDFQSAGGESEVLQPVYYTSSNGYAQSPYNPYNPYIPSAVIGVDGSYVEAPQYYTVPNYQDLISSSPTYFPVVIQPDTGVAFTNGSDQRSSEHGLTSSYTTSRKGITKPTSGHTNSLTQWERSRTNVGQKHSMMHGSVSSSSAHALEGRDGYGSGQVLDDTTSWKVQSLQNQKKVAFPVYNSSPGWNAADKFGSKIHVDGYLKDVNAGPNALVEKNSGPRTSNKWKNQLTVKAYTTKVGDSDEQGNITIHRDNYNKADFSTDYCHAKFFVIKSYSEDDVHKSIKYNVWSSTPNGNMKLQNAYEDAHKLAAEDPTGCPVFLFFSVNASGQFCGVAEMTGPVNFDEDMDFWQQDKWSGSFPVKWRAVKDIANTSFRHIILKNNENKPVTNSRDTQEIMYKQGLEMLKVFKNYVSRTSLLDDFMYYENRQRIMQEERARHVVKQYENPSLESTQKVTCLVEQSQRGEENTNKHRNTTSFYKAKASVIEVVSSDSGDTSSSIAGDKDEQATMVKEEDDTAPVINFGSLSINPEQAEAEPSCSDPEKVNMVTVGSMPVKVNGFAASSGVLTVGTIPLNPGITQ